MAHIYWKEFPPVPVEQGVVKLKELICDTVGVHRNRGQSLVPSIDSTAIMNLNNVVDVGRPGMRRKSSAQNLLSSFKNSTAQIQANMNVNSATPSPNMPPATPTAVFTPVSQASHNKEWDSQSIVSDPMPPPPLVQGQLVNGVDYIRDLVQKRIVTMTYLRNVHEG